jgi:hypothetical protein
MERDDPFGPGVVGCGVKQNKNTARHETGCGPLSRGGFHASLRVWLNLLRINR